MYKFKERLQLKIEGSVREDGIKISIQPLFSRGSLAARNIDQQNN